jgi:hypothetical protein
VLETTPKASEGLATVSGAPAMLGSCTAFMTLIKGNSQAITGTHCISHKQALANKTLLHDL